MLSFDGRLNNAFVNRDGRKVPAGSILDATYRWMFDSNLHLVQFEIVQRNIDLVEARVGAALMRHALRQAKALGYGAVLLDGDPAYYNRFGFSAS